MESHRNIADTDTDAEIWTKTSQQLAAAEKMASELVAALNRTRKDLREAETDCNALKEKFDQLEAKKGVAELKQMLAKFQRNWRGC
ncbi:hypothetical protein HK102_012872 [Quaeritorhiza haematococci]|nr:hypothetical protein HK102_012872 [Quaeritorhiza haematococci]